MIHVQRTAYACSSLQKDAHGIPPTTGIHAHINYPAVAENTGQGSHSGLEALKTVDEHHTVLDQQGIFAATRYRESGR